MSIGLNRWARGFSKAEANEKKWHYIVLSLQSVKQFPLSICRKDEDKLIPSSDIEKIKGKQRDRDLCAENI